MSPDHFVAEPSGASESREEGSALRPGAPDGWQNVRRLLAVRLDNVGDVLMTGPALRAVRVALPGAEITLLASPAGSQVAPLLPWIDDVMVERVSWQDAAGSMPQDADRELALVDRIRAARFDAAIIFTSFSQSPDVAAYACYLAGIPIRVGQSSLFSGSILSQRVLPPPDDGHQVDRNLNLVEAAGFTVLDRALAVEVPAEVDLAAARRLARAGIDPDRPFAVVAPGASCPARRYDPRRFAQLVRRLSIAAELPVVVVGSGREVELCASVVDAALGEVSETRALETPRAVDSGRDAFLPVPTEPIVSLGGRTSIAELAAIVARASLLVANDSGPMHLADAVGTPMVILFSGTELERQWRPRRAPATLLRRRTACSPCYRFECPYHMECLDIEPAEVVREALHLLATSVPAAARPGLAPTTNDASAPATPAAAVSPALVASASSTAPASSPAAAKAVSGATNAVTGTAPAVSGTPSPVTEPAHHRTARPARSVPTPGPARLALPPVAHRRRNETDAITANPDLAHPRELPLLPRPRRP